MKLIVFSDSHRRNVSDMLAIIEEEAPDAVIYLGDVCDDADDIRSVFPDLPLHEVRGNNDFGWRAETVPLRAVVEAEQVRIFITHGHLYGVRKGTFALAADAKKEHCQAALYGHTHEAEIDHTDGILIANPGSISRPRSFAPPSYLRLTVSGTQIEPELIYLSR